MRTKLGLWIDHRKTLVVAVTDKEEETILVISHVERQPGRYRGIRSTAPYESQQVPADDSRERRFTGHLNIYYDAVIACVRNAESILIFGPGEAKHELKKRLERKKLGGRIVGVETIDKMSDRQVAAKVRQYFREEGARMGS